MMVFTIIRKHNIVFNSDNKKCFLSSKSVLILNNHVTLKIMFP